ncbi:MAG: VOC family protein [Phenylobacterium sp.]|uniref:VOC family protein n=1 Tax=Phenylobacterium sp. TaxID=1871053 RepID=UPI001A5C5A6F|nr:VOC family protein [Phenylobacterium sp.]MBL8553304.1 VOC family protein [Phenylobacterium sp.]
MIRKPTLFAHVVYRTRRFEEMIAWYEAVFGAQVQHENPAMAFLTYDGEHHRFAFLNLAVVAPDGTPEADRRGAVGVDHVAYTTASITDLLENYAELKARGITPYWCVHHGLAASLYYADPDGNQMEFQVDAFEGDGCNDFIRGEAMNQNPVGVEFDPDAWLAQLRGGAPEAELLVRTVHEPISPIRGFAGAL